MKLLLLLFFVFAANAFRFARRPWSISRTVRWQASLKTRGWSVCPRGYLLTGLYRSSCRQLYCVTKASCRLPLGAAATRCFIKRVKFNKAGGMSCPRRFFMAGIRRTRNCDNLDCINKLYCCTSPRGGRYGGSVRRVRWGPLRRRWRSVPRNTYLVGLVRGTSNSIFSLRFARYASLKTLARPHRRASTYVWSPRVFKRSTTKGWVRCPRGSLLTGLFRRGFIGRGRRRRKCNNIDCITRLACNKPFAARASQCFSQNIWLSFDKKGRSSCPRNYYVAGYWKNTCNKLYCIENLYCCTVPGTRYAYRPRKANWWLSFDKAGLSQVPRDTYITGFWRNVCNKIYCIELAYYSSIRNCRVIMHRWRKLFVRPSFQRRNRWVNCPRGFLLTGLFRKPRCNKLSCMNKMKCARPTRPATKCYVHNVRVSFNKKGTSRCAPNYFIAGMRRGRCNSIKCIQLLRCCTIPNTKYFKVRVGRWRRKHVRWGIAPRNAFVLGFWRTGCKSNSIYCIQRVIYASMRVNNCKRRGPGRPLRKVRRWSLIRGRLINVAAGIRGRKWGVNARNFIYTQAPFSPRWTRVSGRLKQIDIGRDGTVCGVNRVNTIYCRRRGKWVRVLGKKLKNISVLRRGVYYGVTRTNKIFRYARGKWTKLNGSLKQISVGKDGTVCGVNRLNRIYCTQNNGKIWIRVGGRLKWVSVNDAGELWGVNRLNNIYKGRFDGTPNGAWVKVPGKLKQVDVSYEGLVVGVNRNNRIFAKYPVRYPFRPVVVPPPATPSPP